ncbi:MFS transporter [Candidatus Odyssella acanthamoebae]|uniref:MFS transporter n=1 Tax=Candidatus Odyssella acanthamoebae TaxID=91604 RepID=UPI0018DD950F|nr:MFS transporter [Candidatus Paracaedibacter acanthamoebae]
MSMISKTSLQVSLCGFMSGLCLLLSGNTLNFWLAESNVDLVTLGLFTLVALPYSFKYFISILTNKINFSLRGWLIIAQAMILMCLMGLAHLNPIHNKQAIAVLALTLALGAVIQDIYLDKLRIDKTHLSNRGASASGYIVGYRLGMLSSGAGLIFLSSIVNWVTVFYCAAALFLFISLAIHQAIEGSVPLALTSKHLRGGFSAQIIRPILKIARGKRLIYIISLIILYRLADNLLAVLVNPFQLHLGFNAAEIATASKFFGTTMAIVGGVLGGKILQKIGGAKSLYCFGLIHLLSHFLFIVQAKIGYNLTLLYIVNGTESLTGSMAMVAYIAYLTGLCNKQYGTTQYALLSSIMGLSRTLLPASAGTIAKYASWEACFIIITIIGIPGVVLTSNRAFKKLN